MDLWSKPSNLQDPSRQKKVAILFLILFILTGSGFIYLGNMVRSNVLELQEISEQSASLVEGLRNWSSLLFVLGFIFIAIGVLSLKFVPAWMRWEAAQKAQITFYMLIGIYILGLFLAPLVVPLANALAMLSLVSSKRMNLNENKRKAFFAVSIILIILPIILFFVKS